MNCLAGFHGNTSLQENIKEGELCVVRLKKVSQKADGACPALVQAPRVVRFERRAALEILVEQEISETLRSIQVPLVSWKNDLMKQSYKYISDIYVYVFLMIKDIIIFITVYWTVFAINLHLK